MIPQVLENMKKSLRRCHFQLEDLLIQERTRPGQSVDLEGLEGKNRILLANESHGCPSKSVRLLKNSLQQLASRRRSHRRGSRQTYFLHLL